MNDDATIGRILSSAMETDVCVKGSDVFVACHDTQTLTRYRLSHDDRAALMFADDSFDNRNICLLVP